MDNLQLVATPDGRWRTDNGRVWLVDTTHGYQLHVDGIDLGPFTEKTSAIKAAELLLAVDGQDV